MKTLSLRVLVACWLTALSAGGQQPVVAETAAADNARIEEVLKVDVKDLLFESSTLNAYGEGGWRVS